MQRASCISCCILAQLQTRASWRPFNDKFLKLQGQSGSDLIRILPAAPDSRLLFGRFVFTGLHLLPAMARHSSALLKAAVVACGLLALNQLAFLAPGSSPKLRGQEAAVAGAVLAGLPAAPALATDQASDAFSQQDAILIFIPIIFVWILFLDWEGKQPSADDVTGYGALGPTVDGPTPDQPAYFRRSPENG